MATSGDVIDTSTFKVSVLNDILSQLGNAGRKIAISIHNETGRTWSKGSVYFESGTSDSTMPGEVKDKQTMLLGCRKTSSVFIVRDTDGVIYYVLYPGKAHLCCYVECALQSGNVYHLLECYCLPQ